MVHASSRDWSSDTGVEELCALDIMKGDMFFTVSASAAELAWVNQRPEISFHVAGNGNVSGVRVKRSSGSETLDQKASALVLAQRYKPNACGACDISSIINIDFDGPIWLNEHNDDCTDVSRVSAATALLRLRKFVPVATEPHLGPPKDTVTLRVVVDAAGGVWQINRLDGHPILTPKAINAVRQWEYTPFVRHGKASAVCFDIRVPVKSDLPTSISDIQAANRRIANAK